MRRIFIGPRRVDQPLGSGGTKGKGKAAPRRRGYDSSSSSSSSSDDDSINTAEMEDETGVPRDSVDYKEHLRRAKAKAAKVKRRALRQPSEDSAWPGLGAVAVRTAKGKATNHAFEGTSYEIGGEIRAGRKRRELAERARAGSVASTAVAGAPTRGAIPGGPSGGPAGPSNQQEATKDNLDFASISPRPALSPQSPSTASFGSPSPGARSPAPGSELSRTESFETAHTHLDVDSVASRTSRASRASRMGRLRSGSMWRPADPPAAVEAAQPILLQQLMRTPSDLGPGDAASMSAVPVETKATPIPARLIPARGILRTASGSNLGVGHPTSAPNGKARDRRVSTAKTVQLPPPDLSELRKTSGSKFRFPTLGRSRSNSRLSQVTNGAGGSGALPPAPVAEVLARPADEAGVVDDPDEPEFILPAPERPRPNPNGILRKERMLVRRDFTSRQDLPRSFDEDTSRKYPTHSDGWEEMAVVWRGKRIELWGEYVLSATSLFKGGEKNLKHVVELDSRKTSLSLFSSVDSIFCLASQSTAPLAENAPTTAKQRSQQRKKDSKADAHEKKTVGTIVARVKREGTYIYMFRPRATSIAKEWMFLLYRQLGGKLPSVLDVSVPGLGARLRLPVPEDIPRRTTRALSVSSTNAPQIKRGVRRYLTFDEREGEGYRILRADSVVEACAAKLATVTDWKELFETVRREGTELKLCWRRGDVLDWVETSGDKDWSVIGGWAMRQPHLDVQLELRLGLHYPTTVRIPATKTEPSWRLSEPPGVEGFLSRISRTTSSQCYISTRDGHLFYSRSASAHPPPPPPVPVAEAVANPAALVLTPFLLGFAALGAGSNKKRKERVWSRLTGDSGWQEARDQALEAQREAGQGAMAEGGDQLDKLEREEVARAIEQVVDARGYVDLREITVRKVEGGEATDYEMDMDQGGDDRAAKDLQKLRKQRSFRLGFVADEREFIFEVSPALSLFFKILLTCFFDLQCHSIAVAEEWVGRLNALIDYWTRRELADIHEQLAHQSSSRYRVVRPGDEERPPPEGAPEPRDCPLLASTYHHCVLNGGCRPIFKAGTVYVKHGLRGTWRERQLFLLPGILLTYGKHSPSLSLISSH